MPRERLNPELQKRIEMVDEPGYEGEPLSKTDHVFLVLVGLLIPFGLMIWGW